MIVTIIIIINLSRNWTSNIKKKESGKRLSCYVTIVFYGCMQEYILLMNCVCMLAILSWSELRVASYPGSPAFQCCFSSKLIMIEKRLRACVRAYEVMSCV